MYRKMLIALLALAMLASVATPAFAQAATRQGTTGQTNQNKIMSAFQSRQDLSQFTDALKQSDLYQTVNNGGQYTIFAPINDAFDRMPSEKASIMKQTRQGMDYVLGYHIVSGKLSPKQLKSTNSLTTLNTRTVPISMAGGDIMIDGARIMGQGIDAGNVMIYPVNAVMVPPMLT